MSTDGVDLVIPHVDGAAPGYESLCRRWTGGFVPSQLRDLGELRYLLRSIAVHAPWFARVVLVVQDLGHVPTWLARDRVRIVCHEAFLPAALLPTFHWATIAAHVHRIADLRERFVLWEDDVLLGSALAEGQLFDAEGLPRTGVCMFPIWQATDGGSSGYGRNLAHSRELVHRCARARERRSACYVYPHIPLPVRRSEWAEFMAQHEPDPIFTDTITRRSRGDEAARPTIDPIVVYANWLDLERRGRSPAARLLSCLRCVGGHGAAPRFGSYPVVNDLRRLQRTLARLRRARATFLNLNDEAYDSWQDERGDHPGDSARPNPRCLSALHSTLDELYPTASHFERSPP